MMSSTRKSSRVRTLTAKVRELLPPQPTNTLSGSLDYTASEAPLKKRKLTETPCTAPASDKIDPVEKLLSLTNTNNDILLDLEGYEDDYEGDLESQDASKDARLSRGVQNSKNSISLNFTKILNDNLRSYYSNFKRCPIEIYNDNSSFSILNRKKEEPVSHQQAAASNQAVPFFRNVNFNPKNPSAYTFDQYLEYDEDDDAAEDDVNTTSTESETEEHVDEGPKGAIHIEKPLPTLAHNKMSFHYRHNDNLNLSVNGAKSNSDPQDVFKILNKRSILNGRASEMVSTGNFLINDFFL